MELSWSTLVLEIINFGVLMWLLLHFFYRPLQKVIARRQSRIEEKLREAQALKEQAQQLQERYENRLTHWEQERQSAREALATELAEQRKRLEEALHHSLEQQRQKAEVVAQRRSSELQERIERQAMEQAAGFAARLLSEGAGPELQSRLNRLLLEALPELDAEQIDELRSEAEDHTAAIEVQSAFALGTDEKTALKNAFESLLDKSCHCEFNVEPELIAGLRIAIGPWVLHANVQDELRGFLEFSHDAG
ncbi:F0F1 ATP synthase subunit delta [Marinobacterium sp. YM272]|uniref:F0F1 ATP synthase subunit delta n=1 Tax=Marinobacterium sp. YM272 TaxID=3421654 RepID=UPI003D7F44CF